MKSPPYHDFDAVRFRMSLAHFSGPSAKDLELKASPDIQSITIDSYTRLKKFDQARYVLESAPEQLNGYPLVTHGYLKGRDLNESVSAPFEIRHGSPDARLLFEVAIASGITSFEGGGIGYNLPYCKNVPLSESLRAWKYVDDLSGDLTRRGVVIDRELFGTLSAVIIPPSIALTMTMIEAILASRSGVKCLSIAYPQGGNLAQDIAALRAIHVLANKYLPEDVNVYSALHEFMGMFPKDPVEAKALIFYGALTAKLGKASKIITKTHVEAYGIPTSEINAEGILTARMAEQSFFNFIRLPNEIIEEELELILTEVDELLLPLLNEEVEAGIPLGQLIEKAFLRGTLDIPFATSRFAKSQVIPLRDCSGAIRYANQGNLPFSSNTMLRNRKALNTKFSPMELLKKTYEDICYFSSGYYHHQLNQIAVRMLYE